MSSSGLAKVGLGSKAPSNDRCRQLRGATVAGQEQTPDRGATPYERSSVELGPSHVHLAPASSDYH